MTTRLQCGQKLPTNMGVFRLINALVKKRVKSIYLPQRWIELNNTEAQLLKTENFGVYGLLLTERFIEDTKAQKELMKVLVDLGITDIVKCACGATIEDFNVFRKEQELLFQYRTNGEKFLFDKNRTFRQIQEHLNEKNEAGKKAKEARDQVRNTCSHQIEEIICDGCRDRCKIQKCVKCTLVKVTPPWSKKFVNLNGLLCNRNWENSHFLWDKAGFYP